MNIELSEEQIEKILQGIKIPAQPQVIQDLQREQMMPYPDLDNIARYISQDVSLAGTTLKIVNSPFYGLRSTITSIQQAVRLLGLNSVINLINGLALKKSLADQNMTNMIRFWDSANDIAQISLLIAKQVGYPKPDVAYLLGLFHNCGIPLLLQRFEHYPDIVRASYAQSEQRIVDIENQQLNTNHAVIGYYIAKSWNLPKIICDVIAEHHSALRHFNIDNLRDSDAKTLLAILKLAEHLCGNYRILGEQDDDFEWQKIGAEILTYLGLSDYDLEQMRDHFDELGLGA